jgi:hypothetical protein
MTYSFRSRFHLREPVFHADAAEYHLEDSVDEGSVNLRAARPNARITPETMEFAVQASGYPDIDAAVVAGRRWRRWLISALARDLKAAEFGDDEIHFPEWEQVVTGSSDLLESIGIVVGDVCAQDRVGLLIFETEPPKQFLIFAPGQPIVTQSIEQFLEGPLRTVRENAGVSWDAKQNRAYALIHSALSTNDHEVRYIQLVTAIEALLDQTKRPAEVLAVLGRLKTTVRGLDDISDDTRKRALDILSDQRESVNQRGKALASRLDKTYDGMTSEKYFGSSYGKRSDLVHANLPIPDVREYRTLLSFVLDLLDVYRPAET